MLGQRKRLAYGRSGTFHRPGHSLAGSRGGATACEGIMGACRRPRVPCAGADGRSRSRWSSRSQWPGSRSASSSRAAARRHAAPPRPRRGDRRRRGGPSPSQGADLARLAPARPSVCAARPRSRLRADRRPQQRPAPARLALAARRLALPARRRRPARDSRSTIPTTHSSRPATAGSHERGVQQTMALITVRRHRMRGRTATRWFAAPDRASSPTRTTPTGCRTALIDGRGHPELPRPLGEPDAPDRARVGHAGACVHDPPSASAPRTAPPRFATAACS